MLKSPICLHDVTFGYAGASDPLFENLRAEFPCGWTGLVGANGSGKTTLLALVAGRLRPRRGTIRVPGPVELCEQQTFVSPRLLSAFAQADDGAARELRGRLRIEPTWIDRWHTLSDGERKRAQLGLALWRRPRILLVDEPTNHLDRDARGLLLDALAAFRGIGLIVSHDRELLDRLCTQCLMLTPPGATMRPGGFTQASATHRAEQDAQRALRARRTADARRLQQEASRRRDEAARSDSLRSKRKLARGDSDGRARIDRARVSGKDGQAGRRLRQMQGAVEQAERAAREIDVPRERRLGIGFATVRSERRAVLRVAAGVLELGGGRRLAHPELHVAASDRIGLCGPNGAGKSSLARELVRRLETGPDRVLHIPQEFEPDLERRIVARFVALSSRERGAALSGMERLGSSAPRVIESERLSPGELRKLALVLGMLDPPAVLVLDEPTNHLDLPSIACLERALASLDAAMILVSHDERFLQTLVSRRWTITLPGPLTPAKLIPSTGAGGDERRADPRRFE